MIASTDCHDLNHISHSSLHICLQQIRFNIILIYFMYFVQTIFTRRIFLEIKTLQAYHSNRVV